MKKLILPLIMVLPLVSANAREIAFDTELELSPTVFSVAVDEVFNDIKKENYEQRTNLLKMRQEIKEIIKVPFASRPYENKNMSLQEVSEDCLDTCGYYSYEIWNNDSDNQCKNICSKLVDKIVEVNNKRYSIIGINEYKDKLDILYIQLKEMPDWSDTAVNICKAAIKDAGYTGPVFCDGFCTVGGSNIIKIKNLEDYAIGYSVKSFCTDNPDGGGYSYLIDSSTGEILKDWDYFDSKKETEALNYQLNYMILLQSEN